MYAWTDKAFSKIVGDWGEVLFIDVAHDESMSVDRVCVRTKKLIPPLERVQVKVKGDVYEVLCKELMPWSPLVQVAEDGMGGNLQDDCCKIIEELPLPDKLSDVGLGGWVMVSRLGWVIKRLGNRWRMASP
ncbi:hypothetical protein L1987_28133 [Smallanthus sonchifolius]|uniref:Uncharacterized protein n=1 Tax=Smallanthus sonchifolius TaxID=185202 RepID=A0ACB9IC67_9ASTR|nr:hypothetical protein L1987_28133 [Smallanthus sonchifolius]